LVSFYETVPPYWKVGVMPLFHKYVGDPSRPEDRRRMEAKSPLFRVDQVKRPLLIIHGAKDTRVNVRESEQMVAALRAAGTEVRWREIAGGEAPTPGALGAATPGAARVPRAFLDLARQVAGAHDPARWPVLYEVLWRLVHDDRDLLKATRDPTVRRLTALAAQARREAERAEQAEALQLEHQGAGAASFVSIGPGLAELRAAAARCTGCDLYRHATQTVLGRGPAAARLV